MLSKIIATSRINEVSDVATRIVGVYANSGIGEDANLASMIELITESNQQLIEAVKRIKTESDLEQKDEERDQALRAFYYFVTGNQYNPDVAIQTAVHKLLTVLDHYGLKIIDETYAAESTLIESLLNDLASDEMQTALAALSGADALLQNLKNAQTEFESSRITFDQAKTSDDSKSNAGTLKSQLVVIINSKLVVYLRAMTVINSATYDGIASTIDNIIDENNALVKSRSKKQAS